MQKKLLNFFAWILGGAGFIYGFISLSSQPLVSVYLFSLAFMIFPPLNRLILKSKHAKKIKVAIGILFFTSLIAGSLLQQDSVTGEDKYKSSNVTVLKTVAKNYCVEKGQCPESLDQLFNEGYTGPFESFRHEDYYYRQIDEGKDCVISTTLSNGEVFARLCIGDNLEYNKYLRNPEN